MAAPELTEEERAKMQDQVFRLTVHSLVFAAVTILAVVLVRCGAPL